PERRRAEDGDGAHVSGASKTSLFQSASSMMGTVCKYTTPMLTSGRLRELLQLEPLPIEGGYFRRTYLASEAIDPLALPKRYTGPKPFASAIFFLLTPTEFSALHRLRTDELYHFYLGDAVEQLLLFPDGQSRVVTLGHDLEAGQHVQSLVPHGVWQGSRLRPGGDFALLGATMAPAYDPDDFELGDRGELVGRYPGRAEWIHILTRSVNGNA